MNMLDTQARQLSKTLDSSYAKIPALPANIREVLVSIAPWIALIVGVLWIVSFLVTLLGAGALTALAPYAVAAGVGGYIYMAYVISIISLIEGVLLLLAFSALKAKKARGWNLWFWVLVLSLVSSVVSLSVGSVIGGVIGFLIGYYFLYQVKSYYN